jgi:hypothetical protein
VQSILEKVEEQLQKGAVKASLGDYIRLLQLSKEITEETKTDIRVGWVDSIEE